MLNPVLTKSFVAESAVTKYRIVKFGSDDDSIVQAAAASDAMFGVADSLGASANERVDVYVQGVAEVEYGGTVTRGALLTADSNGKAVAASSGNRIIGTAMVSGVSGDVGSVLIGHGIM